MGRIFPLRKDFRLPENLCAWHHKGGRGKKSVRLNEVINMSEIIFILFTFWVVRCNFSCVVLLSFIRDMRDFFLVGQMLQQQPHHLYAAPFFKQKYLFSREEVCNMLQRNFALIDIHTIRREIWVKPHDHTTTTSLQQEVTFCTNMPSAFQLTFASKSRKE